MISANDLISLLLFHLVEPDGLVRIDTCVTALVSVYVSVLKQSPYANADPPSQDTTMIWK